MDGASRPRLTHQLRLLVLQRLRLVALQDVEQGVQRPHTEVGVGLGAAPHQLKHRRQAHAHNLAEQTGGAR